MKLDTIFRDKKLEKDLARYGLMLQIRTYLRTNCIYTRGINDEGKLAYVTYDIRNSSTYKKVSPQFYHLIHVKEWWNSVRAGKYGKR